MIAEWEEQDGIIMAFPNEHTAWVNYLQEAQACVVNIVKNIALYEKVYLLCINKEKTASFFLSLNNIELIICPYDDTWMRDCNVFSVRIKDKLHFRGFIFNGWGNKFKALNDNNIKFVLHKQTIYKGADFKCFDYVLEAGAIESNGKGVILTTSSVLLDNNRNENGNKDSATLMLKNSLGAKKILWLDHGCLIGDDTNGHIDTVARFCSKRTIAYVGLPPIDDEHYKSFTLMKKQLHSFCDLSKLAFNLVELPFVPAIYYKGKRLPASYANFLIINNAVLVPTYGVLTDTLAIAILQQTFKDRKVIAINCNVLIRESGSLHCMTMQLPK